MKQYFVVTFLETQEVDIVSSEWIEGEFCFWPPYKFSKLKSALVNHEKPGQKWKKFTFKIMGSYTSYGKARKALTRAEENSDINSDAYSYGRGQRKRVRNEFSSDEEIRKKVRSNSCSNEEEDSNFRLSPMPEVPSEEIISTPTLNSSCISLPQAQENGNSEFQAIVIRELKVIKSLSRQNQEMMDTILSFMNRVDMGNGRGEKTKKIKLMTTLPLETMQQLVALEQELEQDPEAFSLLTNQLKIVGGINYENMVRRILRSFMVDSLAAQFSWLGTKGKRPFASLHSVKCFFDAVRCNPMFVQKHDSEIENIVRNWLRHAPARCKQTIVVDEIIVSDQDLSKI